LTSLCLLGYAGQDIYVAQIEGGKRMPEYLVSLKDKCHHICAETIKLIRPIAEQFKQEVRLSIPTGCETCGSSGCTHAKLGVSVLESLNVEENHFQVRGIKEMLEVLQKHKLYDELNVKSAVYNGTMVLRFVPVSAKDATEEDKKFLVEWDKQKTV
jgi:hypothetical protein